ncbi:hypothetical protein FKM82_002343 [Ascaphus truei]
MSLPRISSYRCLFGVEERRPVASQGTFGRGNLYGQIRKKKLLQRYQKTCQIFTMHNNLLIYILETVHCLEDENEIVEVDMTNRHEISRKAQVLSIQKNEDVVHRPWSGGNENKRNAETAGNIGNK